MTINYKDNEYSSQFMYICLHLFPLQIHVCFFTDTFRSVPSPVKSGVINDNYLCNNLSSPNLVGVSEHSHLTVRSVESAELADILTNTCSYESNSSVEPLIDVSSRRHNIMSLKILKILV